jgi:hypothetical protein
MKKIIFILIFILADVHAFGFTLPYGQVMNFAGSTNNTTATLSNDGAGNFLTKEIDIGTKLTSASLYYSSYFNALEINNNGYVRGTLHVRSNVDSPSSTPTGYLDQASGAVNPSSSVYGILSAPVTSQTLATAISTFGIYCYADIENGSHANTGSNQAGHFAVNLYDAVGGTESIGMGVVSYAQHYGAGTVTDLYGYDSSPFEWGGGTIANHFGYYDDQITTVTGSKITNDYGLIIGPRVGSVDSVGLFLAGSKGGASPSFGGESGNYGYYGSGRNYAIYQEGTLTPSLFNGPLLTSNSLTATGAINGRSTLGVSGNAVIGGTEIITGGISGSLGVGAAPSSTAGIYSYQSQSISGANSYISMQGYNKPTVTAGGAGFYAGTYGTVAVNQAGYNLTSSYPPAIIGACGIANATGAGGTVSNLGGLYALAENTGAGTLTNGYGLYINSPANSGGGTFSNAYGIYVKDQTLTGATAYDIYAAGAASNYFGGATTFNGTIKIHGAQYWGPQSSAPTAVAEGDVYENTTSHHIFFWNGSSWGQMDN